MKKGIRNILSANIVKMILNVAVTFFMPKFLPVEEYALLKTYQLYATYCGLFHLGYVDAINLKYGGAKFTDISTSTIERDLSNMRFFQVLVSIIMILLGILAKDNIMIFFALTILPMNMISYYQYTFQAIGDFIKYSKVVRGLSYVNFIGNVTLIFIFGVRKGIWFVIFYTCSQAAIAIWMEFSFYIDNHLNVKKLYCSFSDIKDKVVIGFPLMLGNLMAVMVTSIDRWFVKYCFNVNEFAQYSFAVNIQNVINGILSPITLTLYPYFCKHQEAKSIIIIRNMLLIFGSFLLLVPFGVKGIVLLFLPSYLGAVDIIFILLMAQYFIMITNGIYVNLYKAQKKQKKYMVKTLLVLIGSVVFNFIIMNVYRSIVSIAVATLVISFLWLYISDSDFREIYIKFDKYCYILLLMFVYFVCGIKLNFFYGMIVYICSVLVLNFFFFKNEWRIIKEWIRINNKGIFYPKSQ